MQHTEYATFLLLANDIRYLRLVHGTSAVCVQPQSHKTDSPSLTLDPDSSIPTQVYGFIFDLKYKNLVSIIPCTTTLSTYAHYRKFMGTLMPLGRQRRRRICALCHCVPLAMSCGLFRCCCWRGCGIKKSLASNRSRPFDLDQRVDGRQTVTESEALFSSENFSVLTVALSFLFNKHYLIIQ